MEDVLRGRIIREAYHLGKKFVMKLDDGSEVVIEEKGGPGLHDEWDNWTDVSHQKDGKVLSSWRLKDGRGDLPKPPDNMDGTGKHFPSEF
ncbi:MAG: hypothetical protein Q8P76_01695 [bacterium]|nr:hypothetical protein [bacterium]